MLPCHKYKKYMPKHKAGFDFAETNVWWVAAFEGLRLMVRNTTGWGEIGRLGNGCCAEMWGWRGGGC